MVFHPLMFLDQMGNDLLLYAVVLTNGYLVYSADKPSDVVLNSLALEFVLEIDDAIKRRILDQPDQEEKVAEHMSIAIENKLNGVRYVFVALIASFTLQCITTIPSIVLTCK